MAILLALGSCTDTPPRVADHPSPSHEVAPFDGELRCGPGDEHGEGWWEYGVPRGTIVDPVRWVRTHAVGLHPQLELSFADRVGSLEDIVVVMTPEGATIGFVEFGRDDDGRYFPNHSESCASSGIDDFT
jgi:hypothetical protein